MRGIIMSMMSRSGQPRLQPAQRLVAVAGGRDVVAVVAELVGEDDEQVRIVVDEEEPGRALLPCRPAADHHGASIPRQAARRPARPAGRRARRRRAAYGAFESRKRQRGASGQRSQAGLRASQVLRPCWIRSTWAGVDVLRREQVPVDLVLLVRAGLRRHEADPPAHPLHVRVDRHQRQPEAEQEDDRGGLLADPRHLGQPVAGGSAAPSPPGSPGRSRRSASRTWRSAAWMRGAFCGARPPGRMTSISSSSGACSTASQSGAEPAVEAAAAPALGWRLRAVGRGHPVDRHRPIRRVGGAERLERALGVHVGGVLGKDREDELRDGVKARVAPRRVP